MGKYIFKSAQYICQFIWLDFHIIPGGFCCLPGGKLTPRSNPGKFLKLDIFPHESSIPHRGTETECF